MTPFCFHTLKDFQHSDLPSPGTIYGLLTDRSARVIMLKTPPPPLFSFNGPLSRARTGESRRTYPQGGSVPSRVVSHRLPPDWLDIAPGLMMAGGILSLLGVGLEPPPTAPGSSPGRSSDGDDQDACQLFGQFSWCLFFIIIIIHEQGSPILCSFK